MWLGVAAMRAEFFVMNASRLFDILAGLLFMLAFALQGVQGAEPQSPTGASAPAAPPPALIVDAKAERDKAIEKVRQ
ncbi:MAG: hypothetical protein ACREYA_09765 [Cupriavidus necator]